MRSQFLITTIALCCSALITCGSAHGQNIKTLRFPTELKMGQIFQVPKHLDLECGDRGQPIGPARGVIRVPANAILRLIPDGDFYRFPEFIEQMPADAFQYIQIRFTAMEEREINQCDKAMKYVPHFRSLRVVDLDKSDTSDIGASELARLPELTVFSATDTTVRGSFLKALKACKNLQMIRLGLGMVDNNELRHLKDYPKLRRLVVTGGGLNRVGLSHICECKHLERMDISRNKKIDDSSVPDLLKLPKSIRVIELQGTSISAAKLASLAKVFHCKILAPKPRESYSAQELKILAPYGNVEFDQGKIRENPFK